MMALYRSIMEKEEVELGFLLRGGEAVMMGKVNEGRRAEGG